MVGINYENIRNRHIFKYKLLKCHSNLLVLFIQCLSGANLKEFVLVCDTMSFGRQFHGFADLKKNEMFPDICSGIRMLYFMNMTPSGMCVVTRQIFVY
jgi:hypothetical protein